MLVISWLPYIGDAAASKSKPLADQISRSSLCAGFAWLLAAVSWAVWMQGTLFVIAPLFASFLALLVMVRLLRRRLGGFNGDGLGATQQVCEIACYLGLAVVL